MDSLPKTCSRMMKESRDHGRYLFGKVTVASAIKVGIDCFTYLAASYILPHFPHFRAEYEFMCEQPRHIIILSLYANS